MAGIPGAAALRRSRPPPDAAVRSRTRRRQESAQPPRRLTGDAGDIEKVVHQARHVRDSRAVSPAVALVIDDVADTADSYLFPGRRVERNLSVRQYSRIVKGWASCIGLDQNRYGTHSLRRTKATLIYKRTKNIRAIQLLLGHTKLESTVRYLGIEVDDALEISEQTEI
ncbi:hypothetical protein EZ242_11495 [Ramlibacter rhizophilus]|uniref:Tyr recombinase domain-containing protein n=1 Tax=Ramlibacter rhizophilus TaxID=1781167 RepID=A0A4Z0BND4_9BURK|nr:hypothetical protein EZ242_11495 [Ramlibacter rhizophilus]